MSAERSCRFGVLLGGLLVLTTSACSSSTRPPPAPVCTSVEAIELPAGSCLLAAAEVTAHARGGEVIGWVETEFDAIRTALGLDAVEVRLVGGGPRVIPEVGSGGYASTSFVELQVDLDTDFAPEYQRGWFVQLLAHELHHVARLRERGNPRSVGALVVFEGMADRFALDYGARTVSPWSSALDASATEHWVNRILDEHPQRDYSVNAWLFGTTPEIPRWAGYTAGFHIVGRYLEATGRTAGQSVGDEVGDIVNVVRSNR